MKLFVFYTENKILADSIADAAFDQGIIEGDKQTYEIVVENIEGHDAFDEVYFSDAAKVMVEWNSRFLFLKLALKKINELSIIFYNDQFMADIDDTSEIDHILQKALANKNYNLCKSINEFYAFVDVIKHKETVKAYPSKIQLETTDLCNAKCIMCSHIYDIGSGKDILSSGILDRLIDVLPFLKNVILHGNGEPFLKKDITKYLDRLAEYGIRFITNTNMSILSDDILRHLKNNFDELNISCDGHEKKLYEEIRGGLSFDTFVENVSTVRSKCPDLYMRMMVVVMRQNLNYLSDIVSFAADLGFDEVDFNLLCTDSKIGNDEDSPLLYPDLLKENAKAAILCGEKRKIRVVAPYDEPVSNINSQSNDSQSKDLHSKEYQNKETINKNLRIDFSGICDWLVEGPFIDLKGNAAICCINQNMVLGNVLESSFDEVWNGEYYRHFRKCFFDGCMPMFCNGCDWVLQERQKYLSVLDIGKDFWNKKPRE